MDGTGTFDDGEYEGKRAEAVQTILANPRLMDFDRSLTIVTPNGEQTVDLEIDEDIAAASVRETGDSFLSWVYEIPVSLH